MDPLRKDKTPIAFRAQTSNKELSLDIFDVIGESFFGEGITVDAVKGAMEEAGDFSSVIVNVSSPGGDMFQGVSIRNLLSQCGKPVNINVVGMCASAASLIATSGKVTMAPGTCYMLHEAQGMSMGDADTMRKMADTLETVTSSAADLYVEKTGKPKVDVLAHMKAETWLTPEEAVKNGYADSVGGKKAPVKNSFDLSLFRNAPAELKNAAIESAGCTCDCESCMGGDCNKCTHEGCDAEGENCVDCPMDTAMSNSASLDLYAKQLAINMRK